MPNIEKKNVALIAIIAVLAATLFVTVLTRNSDDDAMGMHHGASFSSSYTGADVMFLQMMIPHHQQAIDISNLALKVSQDPELRALATTIRDAQSAEILQMKAWLNDAGAGTDMGHWMDGMGGMLDDKELADLSAATGTTFDKLWLKGMIGHHDGAVHMTTMIKDASDPAIKAFGEKVVKDQSAQIVQMEAMLKRIK